MSPPENQVIETKDRKSPKGRKKGHKELSKVAVRSSNQRNYEKEIFKNCHYSQLFEAISLPLETKNGYIIDQIFVTTLERIYLWCSKPSSLDLMASSSHIREHNSLDLKFNEILYHVIEGALPNKKLVEEMVQRSRYETSGSQSPEGLAKFVDCDSNIGSPIYAEICNAPYSIQSETKGK